jgi:hypothetical protein
VWRRTVRTHSCCCAAMCPVGVQGSVCAAAVTSKHAEQDICKLCSLDTKCLL